MKKIINGKMYNTETATLICRFNNGLSYSDFRCLNERLYQKKTGEFFIHGSGGAMTRWSVRHGDYTSGSEGILPITVSEAKEFIEAHGDIDDYIKCFGEVEE